LGAKVTSSKIDVRDASQVENWVKQTIQTFGKLDGAANVAGVAAGHGNHTVATLVSTASHPRPSYVAFKMNANSLRIYSHRRTGILLWL
jgi:NAD(P)-dependent dehydrogenase (short-subunit alcohol dehydrogenase family)